MSSALKNCLSRFLDFAPRSARGFSGTISSSSLSAVVSVVVVAVADVVFALSVESRRRRGELGVELHGVDFGILRRRVAEEQAAVDVVFQYYSRGAGLVPVAACAGLREAAGAGHLAGGGDAGAAFLGWTDGDGDAVEALEVAFWDALGDEGGGAGEFAQLVDWEDAVGYEVGFCGGEVWEDEAGTVDEHDGGGEVDCLEVFCFAGGGGDGDLFGADEGVDGGGFADVGVADEADVDFAGCGGGGGGGGGVGGRREGGGVGEEEGFELVDGDDAGEGEIFYRGGGGFLVRGRVVVVAVFEIFRALGEGFVVVYIFVIFVVVVGGFVALFGERGGEEFIFDALLFEIEIALATIDLLDVVLEVFTAEAEGIAGVDNLDDEVGALDDTPELAPDLEVALEGGEQEIVVLGEFGEGAAPVEEGVLLGALELGGGRGLVPGRAAGHGQLAGVIAVAAELGLLLVRGEEIGIELVAVDDLDVHLLGGEVGVGELGRGEELVEGLLLRDAAHLDPVRLLPSPLRRWDLAPLVREPRDAPPNLSFIRLRPRPSLFFARGRPIAAALLSPAVATRGFLSYTTFITIVLTKQLEPGLRLSPLFSSCRIATLSSRKLHRRHAQAKVDRLAPRLRANTAIVPGIEARTFTLVHRSQQDPLIHDADAPQMVFKELITPNSNTPTPPQPVSSSSRHRPAFSSAASAISTASSRIKTISDLESEYGFKSRQNEGEAALHGIYYDDTEYDYMQHMRDIGVSAEAVFIEAPQASSKQRKHKTPVIPEEEENDDGTERKKTLEELLAEDTAAKNGGNTRRGVELPAEMLPSGGYLKRTYRDQQDVPDTIAGFQPDMDPRLREVLEALDDEAYVGEEQEQEEDFFASLAKSGEVEEFEFERAADFFDEDEEADDDDGWESDATEKAQPQSPIDAQRAETTATDPSELPDPALVGADDAAIESAETNEAWQREFAKFKKDKSKKPTFADSSAAGRTATSTLSFGGDDLASLVSAFNNRKLKKKKVPSSSRTMTSSYSMSSSALFRTEGLTTLDDRFDRIEEEYARDEDEEDEIASGVSLVASGPERQDFGSILDEFLDGYNVTGKRQQWVRRGKQQTVIIDCDPPHPIRRLVHIPQRSTSIDSPLLRPKILHLVSVRALPRDSRIVVFHIPQLLLGGEQFHFFTLALNLCRRTTRVADLLQSHRRRRRPRGFRRWWGPVDDAVSLAVGAGWREGLTADAVYGNLEFVGEVAEVCVELGAVGEGHDGAGGAGDQQTVFVAEADEGAILDEARAREGRVHGTAELLERIGEGLVDEVVLALHCVPEEW
ncbi:hypothetical protein Dda_0191 [Drechslerella dactyloides]|uniref:Low temperature viability protein n=1 Tax=Drechslerella dactyloides TaxID=74499 RepID=A0AAD6J4P8_DREDA|nr:hypothetical protein Dda_0191 [Drechslerella dactyloides]